MDDENEKKNDNGFSGVGKVVSTFQDPLGDAESGWEANEAIFGAVVEEDIEKLEKLLLEGADVNMRSKEVAYLLFKIYELLI